MPFTVYEYDFGYRYNNKTVFNIKVRPEDKKNEMLSI